MAALVQVFDDRDGALVALGRSAELLGARGDTILGAWAATVASLGYQQAKQAVARSPQLLRAATIRDAMTALVEVCGRRLPTNPPTIRVHFLAARANLSSRRLPPAAVALRWGCED